MVKPSEAQTSNFELEAFPQGCNIMNQVVAKLRLSLAIFSLNGDNEFNQSAFQDEVFIAVLVFLASMQRDLYF